MGENVNETFLTLKLWSTGNNRIVVKFLVRFKMINADDFILNVIFTIGIKFGG